MAGAYRTSFDFIETIGFTADYAPPPPYQSWGTEFVYVVADEPGFVSLQHVLVMRFAGPDAPTEPMVVKHWRQDWRYQDPNLYVYTGNQTWQRKRLEPAAVAGTWSQAVFQVDDSPRYQAIGRWQHAAGHATWTSDETWRPLPRREFSVRDDYDVLTGTNRVTILPLGWVHEEDNLKAVLDANGNVDAEIPYLAREAGVNRYEHIDGIDFSAGDDYWQSTAPFWRSVRDAWAARFATHERLSVRNPEDAPPLFQATFELADRFAGEAFDAAAARRAIDETLDRYVDGSGPAEPP
jgi:hypothetical protein